MPISETVNTQVILSDRPVGIPQPGHFEIVEADIPEPKDGEFLVRNEFLSVDPAMRGWTNAAANYSEPVAIGSVMRAITAGKVIASKNHEFAVGDPVVGTLGWQEYAVTDGSNLRFRVPDLPGQDVPLSTFLGVLGSNGITAYFGLLRLGEPKEGDTVVVSTAAGAVGSAVGQIAKLKGCRTVGLTGSDEKVDVCVNEFGYDAAINYRTADLDAALRDACPDGVDVYFDSTSGAISDAVYQQFAIGARSVVCGTASIAVWDPLPTGPRIERTLLVKRARIQGLFIFDFQAEWPVAQADLCQWFLDGRLNYKEDMLEGIGTAPGSIQRLYNGENQGKMLIRI